MEFGFYLRNMTWVPTDEYYVKRFVDNNKDQIQESYLTQHEAFNGESMDYLVTPNVTLVAPFGWFNQTFASSSYWQTLNTSAQLYG